MLPIDYLTGARCDFDESFDWYSQRSARAAARFADAVDAALTQIAIDPNRHPSLDGVHRECPVKKYPFRLVYRVVDDCVLVVAVAHTKRRPGYWSDRT